MSRRGEGIYKRKDGRWEARYIHHYEEGKARYRYLYADTYAGVKAKRNAELASRKPVHLSSNMQKASFHEVAVQWLSKIESTVKEATYTRYYRNVHVYLLPTLGEQVLARLDASSLQAFAKKLLDSGGRDGKALSAKTVSDILCNLKSILVFGQERGYPCADVSTLVYPKRAKNQATILPEEFRLRIENRLWDSEDAANLGILFALYTGVRIGELCGLQWNDVNFEDGTVSICRTVERIKNLDDGAKSKTKVIISEPKTENSQRVIPLPGFLAAHMRRFANHGDHFIATGTAKHTEPHQFYLRYQTFLRHVGVPEYSFHTLRHTFATRCVEKGFDIKALSEILGHSSVTTTLTLYVHPTMEQKRRQMELLAPDP